MTGCGSCTLCCKVLGVAGEVRGEPLNKPRSGWCKHCTPGQGCKVYEDRPKVCVEFQCMWLASQDSTHPLPAELRPDRCGVVISATHDIYGLSAHMDIHKSDAWHRGEIWRFLQHLMTLGYTITLDYGDWATTKTILYRDDRGRILACEEHFSEPDQDGIQWAAIPDRARLLGKGQVLPGGGHRRG